MTPSDDRATQDRPRPRLPLLAALRPRQWIKNVVVLAAPVFAGQLTDPGTLWRSLVTVLLFSMASSGVYLLNDVSDLVEDRAHPLKRHRPLAAGHLSSRTAGAAAVLLLLAAVGLGAALSWELGLVLASYCVINLAYSWALKHEPVIDIATIALGFVLRAVAGGVANDIPLSQWFLLVASFGALYMAAGKRYAEAQLVGEGRAETRRSLNGYSMSYLRFVWTTAAALLIMSYSLWAFEMSPDASFPWSEISIAPFVVAVLRYGVDVDAGTAGEPEEIALKDGMLQVMAATWLVVVVAGLYA
ncbi:decaprenyl-phosphate phosphoribosyltransferase [Nocardioides sp. GCM10028917]|uniref:decaprenyl-phosphate phosphoribosyltransferase n=1 Tax=Nocardioides sp. GCM10028917 TaxID=3273408 RepID=UPI0036102E6E